MKTRLHPVPSRRAGAAFTLVEIAICLAVIGFSMVAIIGVLPTGMRVQKDNREETLINQDAALLMDCIRSGNNVAGINLTNFFDQITVGGTNYNHAAGYPPGYSSALHVVGLLSTPMTGSITNPTVSWVRSFAGVRGDMGRGVRTNTFAYELTTEIAPAFSPVLPNWTSHPANKLWDIRLTFRWPLIYMAPGVANIAGNSRKTFRTQLTAELVTNASGLLYLEAQAFNP